MTTAGQEEEAQQNFPPIEDQPAYYPATTLFPPPPTGNVYDQPSVPPAAAFAQPVQQPAFAQQAQQPAFAEQPYANNYNPQAYGGPGANNYPQPDPYAREQPPPQPPAAGYNEFDAQGRPLQPGGHTGAFGPEHVSASPGTSEDGRPPGSEQSSREATLTTPTDDVARSAEATPRATTPVARAAPAAGASAAAAREDAPRPRDHAEAGPHAQPQSSSGPEAEPEHHVTFDLHPHVAREQQARNHGHDGAHDGPAPHRRAPSPVSSDDSGDTIDEPGLADRFDEHGNRRGDGSDDGEDPLARAIGDIIGGHGGLLDGLFGGGEARSRRR